VFTAGCGTSDRDADRPVGKPEAKLADLIGHDSAVDVLRRAAEIAHATDRVPGCVLLTGRAGLGKTTLAQAFAHELGTGWSAVGGSMLDDPTSLASIVANLRRGDVLFIDEIHSVPRTTLEALYTTLEGRYLDLVVSEGSRSKTVRMHIEPFTLVAATTEEAELPPPFLSRFSYRCELEPFDDETMHRLVNRIVERHECPLESSVRARLVRASHGIPRTAVSLVALAIDCAQADGRSEITPSDVNEALRAKDLDENGFSSVQRKILAVLRTHERPLGVEMLASLLGKTTQAIREIYEPDLLRAGLVVRTPRGRMATRVVMRATA
jgi:Holliday junction DNA helicase RuvB